MKIPVWLGLVACAGCISGVPFAFADTVEPPPAQLEHDVERHAYIGMWVTPDGHIRHELLANGRYDEARGQRKSAYRGRYEVAGNRIEYWDDTGFTADGVFVSADELHHGGMIFLREK